MSRQRAILRDFWAWRPGAAASVFLLVEILAVLLLPLVLGQDPNLTDRTAGFWAPPSPQHWLGTDEVGRDLLARLLYGGRTSLLVGFAAAGLGVVLGVPLGLLAGYKGGKWEYWIMRACDTFQSFPSIILVLAIVNLVGASVWNIILVIGGLGWASVARLVYSGTLSAKKTEYVEASRALGAGDGAILFRTILPNVAAPVLASLPLKVVRAILSESSLSFLGVGLRTPQASWGNLVQSAMELVNLTTRPWAWLPAGLCIVATALALLLVGEGLRRALNPRQRGENAVAFPGPRVYNGQVESSHKSRQPNGGAAHEKDEDHLHPGSVHRRPGGAGGHDAQWHGRGPLQLLPRDPRGPQKAPGDAQIPAQKAQHPRGRPAGYQGP